MTEDAKEQWLCHFIDAIESGADPCTAKAVAFAAVSSPLKNPGPRIPPRKKGRPSTWKITKTGRYRARLGSLPDKWKSEWVRRYKSALKKAETRTDLDPSQQKTIAAKQAWDAIKKQGCRLPASVRPSSKKGINTPPNKRARDRAKYQEWVCPEWEATEKARKKIIDEVVRESKRVEKRERARQRKAGADYKRSKKAARRKARTKEKLFKEEIKARRKKQSPKEYSEEFRQEHGAYGLLPPHERRTKAPTTADVRKARAKTKRPKEYSSRHTYNVGDIIFHPEYGYGQVISKKGQKMTVKFEKAGRGRKINRDLAMGVV